MTESTATIDWTCDRCGIRETLPLVEQPEDWVRWYAISPPRAVVESKGSDLCGPCSEQTSDFMCGNDLAKREGVG